MEPGCFCGFWDQAIYLGGQSKKLYFSEMKNTDLISLLLPEEIVEYFDIIRIEKPPEHFIIELDEKNNPPKLDLGEKTYI